MVEYPIDEASEMLKQKIDQVNSNLEKANEDLSFIREQITTVEVNLARIYNWTVKNKETSVSASN